MSEIRATTISDSAGTGPITLTGQRGATATSSINYVSNSPVSNHSVNISSITDAAAGKVGFNFSSSFSDAKYVPSMGGNDNNYGNKLAYEKINISSSYVNTVFVEGNSTTVEDDHVMIAVFGDLA